MKKIPKWVQSILFLLFLFFLFFFRLPLYLEVPGNIFPLNRMVEVDHQLSDAPGEFYLTTIGVQQLTPAMLVRSFLPYQDLVRESDLFGDFDDFESYDSIQKYYMDSSINNAIKVAFDAAGKDYDFEYNGVYVLQITEESDFIKDLKVGDIVKAVDENSFENSTEFIEYIGNKNVGDKVELQIERASKRLTLPGELIELDSGLTGIGIGLVDDTKIMTNPAVEIHSANIGGPSAGLMFSLELYTQLIEDNLRKNYNIAGTGTIGPDGSVGRIGGIEKKVVAADREEVDYFFAPDDELTEEYKTQNPDGQSNYDLALETAKKINSDMIIIPVKTMADAIEFLERLELKEKVYHDKKIINFSINNRYLNKERLVAKILS